MNEDTTQELPDNRSFEEKVLSTLRDLDERMQRLAARAYDTKPIWERALSEIMATHRELTAAKREITRRLDRIESVTLPNCVEISELDDRVTALESQPLP